MLIYGRGNNLARIIGLSPDRPASITGAQTPDFMTRIFSDVYACGAHAPFITRIVDAECLLSVPTEAHKKPKINIFENNVHEGRGRRAGGYVPRMQPHPKMKTRYLLYSSDPHKRNVPSGLRAASDL
ncbi:hypothetical protein ACJJTC_006488 [Scirpophaga incertulas]